MLENCKRLICPPSLNKVYCIVLYCNGDFFTAAKKARSRAVICAAFQSSTNEK